MPAVFNPLLLGATALDVLVAGQSAPEAITARQQVRLSRLLNILARGSTLYRSYLREYFDPAAQLTTFPVVTKAQLMARFDEWVTDPEIQLADLRAFAADPRRIAQPYLDRYMVWESSGSGGEPGIFVQDSAAMAVYDALEVVRRSPPDSLARCLDPLCLTERIAFVGATGGHFASYVSMQRINHLNPWAARSTRCISIMQPLAGVLQELNDYAPTIIATYPTVATMLADQKALGRLQAAPREVWTGGETLTPAARASIAQTLQCTVRNHYGASEFLTIASECAQGNMHVNADWVILEPVDASYAPVPAGQASFTTLLTHLANTVQPLIRYDMGDQITLHAKRCACGSPLPVIEVSGRHDQTLRLKGRNGVPVAILPLALTTAIEEQGGVFEFQVRQRSDDALDFVVPQQGDAGNSLLRQGAQALQDFVQAQGAAPVQITLHAGVDLQRGRSGKSPRVVAV